jgi:hypothetical protein
MLSMRRTKGFSFPVTQVAGRAQHHKQLEKILKITSLIIAAGLAIATTGALAETTATQATVSTYQTAGVAQVYGRASAPNVKVTGAVAGSDQDSTGRDTKIAVTAGKEAIEFGRS